MGYEQTSVKIVVDVQNREQIDLLKKQVTDLEKATRSGGIDLTSYVEKIRDAFKASNDSSEALRAQISLWEKVRANVSATNPVYAQASAELVTLRKNLDQLSTAYTHVSESAYKAGSSVGGQMSGMTRQYMGLGPAGPSTAELEAEAAAQAEAKAARGKRMESLALGVGFPLMFGGGAGSILGSGIGSFMGEGFGGQILGGALGAKLDEYAKSLTDFAKSLREGGDAAGYLKQSLGYLDPKIADEISNLQQAGLTAQAAKVAFEEMGKAIGEDNAQALKNAGNAWDQFTRDVSLWVTRMEATVVTSFKSVGELLNFGIKMPNLLPSAPAVKEDSTTQAYKDRLAAAKDQLQVSLAQEESAKTILKDNMGIYTSTQKEVAEAQKIVEYNKVIRDLAAGRLSIQEKIVAVQKIESDYSKRINEITRQAQDEQRRQAEEQDRKSEEAARKAKEEQDKALRLQKDKAQVAAQAYETGIQEFQLRNQALNWGRTSLEVAKTQLSILDQVDEKEQTAFDLKSKAAQTEAEIKGTAKETGVLLGQQNLVLLDQQNIRKQNAILALAELEYTTKLKSINSAGEINTTRLQGQSTIAGLQSGIAKQFGGNQSFAYDRLKLQADQSSRFEQQVTRPEQALMALIEKRDQLNKKGNRNEVADLNKQIDYQQQILDLKKAQLPVMDQLELKQEQLNEFTQKYGGFFDAISQGLTSTFDLLVQGTDNWGQSLRKIASTVLQDIAKQLLKIYVIDQSISFLKSAISGINPGGGGGGGLSGLNSTDFFKYANANGNVFAANGIVPYAMGGIVDRPTLFPFAKGVGLMGEAGPEAIIPLKRGADGRLGVAGDGSGTTNVTVNVDAKGSSVQGDGGKGNQLARVVAAAVQAEMIKQKRPGGLLAA
jgi:lambda family phage tail tape measure protein